MCKIGKNQCHLFYSHKTYCDHKKDIWSKKPEISGFFHAQTTKKAGEKP